jgi:hypothetical protein
MPMFGIGIEECRSAGRLRRLALDRVLIVVAALRQLDTAERTAVSGAAVDRQQRVALPGQPIPG